MPPEAMLAPRAARRAHLRLVPGRTLRVADVALLNGERSGALRSYLDAKAAHATATGAFEHHVLGAGSLKATLRDLRPDVVLLHDPFWWPADVAACAREIGARTIAVHRWTSELGAAALPGPSRLYAPLLRAGLRHASRHVDAVMSNVDALADCGRHATIPLGLGVDEVFRPHTGARRGDHVLYVGRLSREKGVLDLLEAAARADDPWPLRIVGSGPLEETLRRRAGRLGLANRISFRPFITDRERLARRFAAARCVVLPGEHETFGLAALQAAACGTPVAACATAPALGAIGALGHRFVPGDPSDLARAIGEARQAQPRPDVGASLSWRHRWDRVFARELAALSELAGG